MDIINSLKLLSDSRKVFHSEADFQFALAWEIQKLYPDAKIRLEYCPASITPNIHIDMLVIIDCICQHFKGNMFGAWSKSKTYGIYPLSYSYFFILAR